MCSESSYFLNFFPCIYFPVEARTGLWPVLLSLMNIKAQEFIEKNLEAILPHLLEVNADNQVCP